MPETQAIDHDFRKRIEVAAGIECHQFGRFKPLLKVRQLAARKLLRATDEGIIAAYKLLIDQCNDQIKEFIGV